MARTALGRLVERRSTLENPTLPLTNSALMDTLGGPASLTGVSVSEDRALSMIAVQACVRLIASTGAGVPLKAYRDANPGREEIDRPVLQQPNPNQTSVEYIEQILTHLLLWGNAFVYKVRAPQGTVSELWPIHPRRVQVLFAGELTNEEIRYQVRPGDKVFVVQDAKSTEATALSTEQIMHIPGLGYDGRAGLPPIRLAREAIGAGLAAEEYAARFFANDSTPRGILQTKDPKTEEQAERMKARWKQLHSGLDNAHDVAVLDNGATFQSVSIPPQDAQLLQSRQWSVNEICRLFGVPPHMVADVERSTSWGSGVEAQTLRFVIYTLKQWLKRIEHRYTREVVLAKDLYAEFKLLELLRGDHAARAAFYASGIQNGWMMPGEAREFENLPYNDAESLWEFVVPKGGGDTGDTGDTNPVDDPANPVSEPARPSDLAPSMNGAHLLEPV